MRNLLEEVLHEVTILHGLWATDRFSPRRFAEDKHYFQIDLSRVIEKIETALSEKPPTD